MAGKIALKDLDDITKKRLGLIKKGVNPDRDEIDRLAYKIIGLLADASSKTIRTQALKKAMDLHIGKRKKVVR